MKRIIVDDELEYYFDMLLDLAKQKKGETFPTVLKGEEIEYSYEDFFNDVLNYCDKNEINQTYRINPEKDLD